MWLYTCLKIIGCGNSILYRFELLCSWFLILANQKHWPCRAHQVDSSTRINEGSHDDMPK